MRKAFPSGNLYMVGDKADTDPLFPDDPYLYVAKPACTITLMREGTPLPDNLTP